MKIHHPNWYDRNIDVKEVTPKQVIRNLETETASLDVLIEATDGKLYGLLLPIEMSDIAASFDQLKTIAETKLKEFEI